jgi:hypothetical protein
MKKFTIAAALALLTLPAWAQEERGRPELATTEPPMLGLHWARGAQPEARTNNAGPKGAGRSPNLIYHNGPVMANTVVTPIFWGTKWQTVDSFKAKMEGLDKFYLGVGDSDYLKTNIEYSSASTQVNASITPNSGIPDYTSGPTRAPSTSMILAEVCKMVASGTPPANNYYPVYTDLKRGNAGYCAWHSWGTCNNVNVQFAFFFDLDGDPGCDPQDSVTGNSPGLAAVANVSGHELSEALTDPRGNAWYDAQGYENSDKCAWDFGTNYLRFTDGSTWKIQGNWSNAAYDSNADSDPFNNRGYANEKGQKGCIDGGSFR